MTDQKKITLNIVANLLSFAITILISLFITPWIVNTLGSEAYGFVGLAQNFVSYASLITVALNAMSSRFVSIEIYKGNYDAANRYFTSTFFANAFLAAVLLPIFTVIIWQLEYLIEIPAHLVLDVKIAFTITFVQFLLNVLLSRYEIATFVTNRLYLNQKNTLIGSALRLLLIIGLFTVFSVKISYLVLATFMGVAFGYAMNLVYTKRYLPQMMLRKKDMNFGCIKELLSSGVWSLVNKLNSLLADGLDLLITNAFIGPLQMGAMALSKTIPTMFYTLRGTLDYPFAPPMTECYAKGDIEGTIRNVRLGNKVLGVLIIAPIAAFILYGISFFKLWVPGEDYVLIYILSILSMLSLLASSCVNSTYTLLTVINRIRFSAIVSLITGLLTLLINFILLKTTNLGVYAIAGTSSILALLKHYFINPLYIAHCLKVKKSTFYHEILTGNLCLVVNLAVGFLFTRFLGTGNTWISLILSAGSFVVVGIIINFFIVFSKNERNAVFSAVRRKLKRG